MSIFRQPTNESFIKNHALNVQLNWDKNFISKFEQNYGLYSPLQKFIDSEYMKDVSKYMFFKTDSLVKAMTIDTIIGSGEIVIRDPRVLMLYHGKVMIGEKSKSAYAKYGEKKIVTDKDLISHAGGKTGARWHERWYADEFSSFMKKVIAFNGR